MSIDQIILLWVNNLLASSLADFIFIFVSERWLFSFPLLLLIIVSSKFFLKEIPFWSFVFGLIFVVIAADQFGGFLKEWLAAPRPCDDFYKFAREGTRKLLEPCYSYKGMPSNHALNFAAAATFVSLNSRSKLIHVGLWSICILVAISRVYLAKHYPSQVLAGLVLGVGIGLIVQFAIVKFRYFRLFTKT